MADEGLVSHKRDPIKASGMETPFYPILLAYVEKKFNLDSFEM